MKNQSIQLLGKSGDISFDCTNESAKGGPVGDETMSF